MATTLVLTLASIVLGTMFGVLWGLALAIPSRTLAFVLQALADVVRALPPLVLLLWIYYALPVLVGVRDMSAFALATIAFSVNLAAFVADAVRLSIASYPPRLIDAILACNIKPAHAITRIVLPDIGRELLPAITILYIGVMKNTAIASIVTVREVVHAADQIRLETFQVIEVYTLLGGAYLAVLLPLTVFARWLETREWLKRR